MSTVPSDVVVVGGGVAGPSAATFTARHGLHTHVIDSGESILRRNAHLENFPGFPAGVNPRQLLDLLVEQAEEAGATRHEATVTGATRTDEVSENGIRIAFRFVRDSETFDQPEQVFTPEVR